MNLHRAARWYARWGLRVFPIWWPEGERCSCRKRGCDRPAKHPIWHLAPNGFKNATTDLDVVDSWWRREPEASIGIAAGGGLFVLDVDVRSGGDDSLAELQAKRGELPDTPLVLTGGGGWHFYFAVPPGLAWHAKIAPGVEIKADGGYLVAPPSMHASGRRYIWDLGHRIDEEPLAELPLWLLQQACRCGPERERGPATGRAAESLLGRAFRYAGMAGRVIPADGTIDERLCVICPWEGEHSSKSTDSATVVFAPSAQRPSGSFWCSHAHCQRSRRHDDVLGALPLEALLAAGADVGGKPERDDDEERAAIAEESAA